MTQNNNSLVTRSTDPEQIDLLDLVLQLWRGKWVIGAFIAVFIVLAGVYITVAKEKWTSSAIIAQPDAAQIATYANALNILYGSAAPSMLDIQNRAINRFNSVARRFFLHQNAINFALPEGAKKTHSAQCKNERKECLLMLLLSRITFVESRQADPIFESYITM